MKTLHGRVLFFLVSVSLVCSCKTTNKANSDTKYLSANNKNATNVALFMGFPTEDGWISDNLWPVKAALEEDAAAQGFKIDAQDQVYLSTALQKIRQAASNVSENGTLLIMMAGHGTPDGQLQTHDHGFMTFANVGAEIAAGRVGKGRIKRLIVLVFSCYSGNWVNGYTQVGASDAFARPDSIDQQLAAMSSVIGDQATTQLAAQMSRSKGIYEQLLVMSSQVYNNYSYGSFFGQTFGQTYRSLRASKHDSATIGDLVRVVATSTPMNSPQYRAYPEYEVLNDYLFRSSPTRDVFATLVDKGGKTGLRLSLPGDLNLKSVGVCVGVSKDCNGAAAGQMSALPAPSGNEPKDRSYFEIDSIDLKPGAHIFIHAFDKPVDIVTTPKQSNDRDGDGIIDSEDVCGNTPAGATVYKEGQWKGCASGETPTGQVTGNPASQTAPVSKNVAEKFLTVVAAPAAQGAGGTWDGRSMRGTNTLSLVEDGDFDGVDDAVDFCYPTPAGTTVIQSGPWQGCSQDQRAKREAMMAVYKKVTTNPSGSNVDSDGDGVPDSQDKCPNTPQGSTVHQEPQWLGCASGEVPTR